MSKIQTGTKDHPLYGSNPPVGPTCCLRKCERLIFAESLLEQVLRSYDPQNQDIVHLEDDVLTAIEKFLMPEPIE